MPYKGSKNQIAEWVVANLPKAKVFVDLFFGGGAVTHAAIISGKYQDFIINDIDARLPYFFWDCLNGKYSIEKYSTWISREMFHLRKEKDAYTSLIWSFGNNGVDYLYAKDKEDFKHAFHDAVYFNRLKPLREFGILLQPSREENVYDRYLDYRKQLTFRLEHLTRLQSLENINRISSLKCFCPFGDIYAFGVDYQSIPIPDNAVIYCDIPYYSTNCGKYKGFDYPRFYQWAEKQDNIFISEYSMPETFLPIAAKEKLVLSQNSGAGLYAKERIYTNKRTYERIAHDT